MTTTKPPRHLSPQWGPYGTDYEKRMYLPKRMTTEVPPDRRFTRASLERALDAHVYDGRLHSWFVDEDGNYVLDLYGRGRSLRLTPLEAYLVNAGLASAGHGRRTDKPA